MLVEIIIIGIIFVVICCLLNNNSKVEAYTSTHGNNANNANPICNCYNHTDYPCDANCQKAKYEVCLIGGKC